MGRKASLMISHDGQKRIYFELKKNNSEEVKYSRKSKINF